MPSERLLHTLLRALRVQSWEHTEQQLFGTAASLLTTLQNPLNLTLLSQHLLASPTLWTNPDGLFTCWRFISIYQSAAVRILQAEAIAKTTKKEWKYPSFFSPADPPIGGNLKRDEWVNAALHGASPDTPRWRHALLIGGLLVGYEGENRDALGRSLKRKVEDAFVKAINIACDQLWDPADIGNDAVSLVLSYCFDLLSDVEKSRLDYDKLLPILVRSALISSEGYGLSGYLAAIDADVSRTAGGKLSWPRESASYQALFAHSRRPLMSSMGALAKVIAHAAENVTESWLVQTLVDNLFSFSKQTFEFWRDVKLSAVIASDEPVSLDVTTMTMTSALLWRVLRGALFTTAIILRSVLSRALQDPGLANDDVAPDLAAQVLYVLRFQYFISSRLGTSSFSQYTFVYLTAIDILGAYPRRVEIFLEQIQPATIGAIPEHALERILDLFFLNTSEHFALVVSPKTSENLMIAAATPYLVSAEDARLMDIFEAAHSVVLASLSTAASAEFADKYVPFYVDALFKVFPRNISTRQFRLAFKTLLQICSPPSALSAVHPSLTEILLELLHHRAWVEPVEQRLPPYTAPIAVAPTVRDTAEASSEESLDEQTALTITLVDSLPFLPLKLLEEWLPLTAQLIWKIQTDGGKQQCQDRFWEVLSNGEMDVERSRVCATWWGTGGGRELVLFGPEQIYEMSGALQSQLNGPQKSKL